MATGDAFWAPRPCFLAPIPALDAAAELLSRAADHVLARDLDTARDLLRQADMPSVRAYAAGIMGRTSADIHRYRPVAGIAEIVDRADRAKARPLQPGEEMAVFERDGFRCRYCGCRVVLAKARAVMMAAMPDALHWDTTDADKHAAFYALTAVADHFVPHARGGSSEPDNLITTCQSCNYGKNNWLIEQVGLIDP